MTDVTTSDAEHSERQPRALLSAPLPPELRTEVRALLGTCGVGLVDNPGGVAVVPQAQLGPALRDVEGLIIGPGRVDADMIAGAPNLRAISKHGIGVEAIDIESATRHGIPVSNTPGSNAASVADLSMGFAVMLARNLHRVASTSSSGLGDRRAGRELRGLRLGLLGLGSVGKAVAERAAGFGMTVAARAPTGAVQFADENGIDLLPLEELLAVTDILVVAVPLTPETHGLIGSAELASMPDGAYVINIARGGIVDEDALLHAIRQGTIGGAGLDVLAHEPPDPHDPLLHDPRIIVTPHVGGATWEAFRRTALAAAENLCMMLEGGSPSSILNDPKRPPSATGEPK